jgi:hypothetical protein
MSKKSIFGECHARMLLAGIHPKMKMAESGLPLKKFLKNSSSFFILAPKIP